MPDIFTMHAGTQHPETEVQKVEADTDLWRAIRRLTDLQAVITPTQTVPIGTPATPAVVEINEQSSLFAHDDQVWALDISPDGALMAVSYENGTTIIWDTSNGEEVLTLPGASWATSNDFSPDGTQLAVGYYEDIA